MQSWLLLQQIFAQTGTLLCMPVFWLAALVLSLQIGLQLQRRQQITWQTQQAAKGLPVLICDVLRILMQTILAGTAGGMIASILLLLTGVSVNRMALFDVWIAALLLVLIRQRFFCFAYAGSAVVLLYLITGTPALDCRQLLMMVAILHFTEAVLVRICGTLQTMPVYLRDKRGKTTTGVQMQMTWPVPLAMPVLTQDAVNTIAPQQGYFIMPDWWPLLDMMTNSPEAAVTYQLMPMLAAIGYSDWVSGTDIETAVQKKTQDAARLLLLYSLLLAILVLFSCKAENLLLAAALFSAAGHEAMLQLGSVWHNMCKYVHIKKEQGFVKFIYKNTVRLLKKK